MLNFREKLNQINREGTVDYSIEKQTEFFLTGLLNLLALQKPTDFRKIVFISNGERISVKSSKDHVTNLFDLPIVNEYCSEIFNSIKKQFKSENFRIEEHVENVNIFTVYFD